LKEKDVNLDIAKKLKKLLEAENYKVHMTREEDRLEYKDTDSETEMRRQDLTRRKNMMDTCGADIVVSIHQNKFDQSQYYGAHVFYPPNQEEGKKLATSLQTAIKELADPSNERVAQKKEKPIIIIRNPKTTTAIVECGFLSNKDEESRLQTDEYRDKLAVAIKEGINRYFKQK